VCWIESLGREERRELNFIFLNYKQCKMFFFKNKSSVFEVLYDYL